MARIYLYADESGNFDFSQNQGATRYFVLTTVAFFDDRRTRVELEELRGEVSRELSRPIGSFHASEDRQAIRDRVFEVLKPHHFRVDATVLDKGKAHPQIRETDDAFYLFAWNQHMRIIRAISRPSDELFVTAASIGNTRKKERLFRSAVSVALDRFAPGRTVHTRHQPSSRDAGLQIADYCSWAIFRRWERGDDRSHRLIQDKIGSEFGAFGME